MKSRVVRKPGSETTRDEDLSGVPAGDAYAAFWIGDGVFTDDEDETESDLPYQEIENRNRRPSARQLIERYKEDRWLKNQLEDGW